jgi:hypothetical protein
LQHWTQFYSVIGAASAALLGLLFVTISMNVKATLGPGQESSRRLAGQAFQNYLAVLMVSLLALYPDMSPATYGQVTLCVTGLWGFWVLVRIYQTAVRPVAADAEHRLLTLRRHLASLIGFGILTVTAFRMATHMGDDFNWFASANIVLLISATTVSWEFLTKIADRAEPSP